jgi:hypothetical protein
LEEGWKRVGGGCWVVRLEEGWRRVARGLEKVWKKVE